MGNEPSAPVLRSSDQKGDEPDEGSGTPKPRAKPVAPPTPADLALATSKLERTKESLRLSKIVFSDPIGNDLVHWEIDPATNARRDLWGLQGLLSTLRTYAVIPSFMTKNVKTDKFGYSTRLYLPALNDRGQLRHPLLGNIGSSVRSIGMELLMSYQKFTAFLFTRTNDDMRVAATSKNASIARRWLLNEDTFFTSLYSIIPRFDAWITQKLSQFNEDFLERMRAVMRTFIFEMDLCRLLEVDRTRTAFCDLAVSFLKALQRLLEKVLTAAVRNRDTVPRSAWCMVELREVAHLGLRLLCNVQPCSVYVTSSTFFFNVCQSGYIRNEILAIERKRRRGFFVATAMYEERPPVIVGSSNETLIVRAIDSDADPCTFDMIAVLINRRVFKKPKLLQSSALKNLIEMVVSSDFFDPAQLNMLGNFVGRSADKASIAGAVTSYSRHISQGDIVAARELRRLHGIKQVAAEDLESVTGELDEGDQEEEARRIREIDPDRSKVQFSRPGENHLRVEYNQEEVVDKSVAQFTGSPIVPWRRLGPAETEESELVGREQKRPDESIGVQQKFEAAATKLGFSSNVDLTATIDVVIAEAQASLKDVAAEDILSSIARYRAFRSLPDAERKEQNRPQRPPLWGEDGMLFLICSLLDSAVERIDLPIFTRFHDLLMTVFETVTELNEGVPVAASALAVAAADLAASAGGLELKSDTETPVRKTATETEVATTVEVIDVSELVAPENFHELFKCMLDLIVSVMDTRNIINSSDGSPEWIRRNKEISKLLYRWVNTFYLAQLLGCWDRLVTVPQTEDAGGPSVGRIVHCTDPSHAGGTPIHWADVFLTAAGDFCYELNLRIQTMLPELSSIAHVSVDVSNASLFSTFRMLSSFEFFSPSLQEGGLEGNLPDFETTCLGSVVLNRQFLMTITDGHHLQLRIPDMVKLDYLARVGQRGDLSVSRMVTSYKRWFAAHAVLAPAVEVGESNVVTE